MGAGLPPPGVGGRTRGRPTQLPALEVLATRFRQADRIRRLQGQLLDALGLGPHQTPSEVVLTQAGVRLRAYQPPGGTDPEALRSHLRVTRWALDEFPFPGRLFEEVSERLYRQDGFARGRLTVGGQRVRPDGLTMPMMYVLNPHSRVVPPSSVLPVHAAAPSRDKRLFSYSGERGVGLQHVGALVGRRAHKQLWPPILAWVAALGPGGRDRQAGRGDGMWSFCRSFHEARELGNAGSHRGEPAITYKGAGT